MEKHASSEVTASAEIHMAAGVESSTGKAVSRRLMCNFFVTQHLELDMAIRSTGELNIAAMNKMNVPVACFLMEPESEGEPWKWTARNFMPGKGYFGSSWDIEADTKEEIVEFVRTKVAPLYRAALNNLEQFGENYYWEPKQTIIASA